MNWLKQFYAKQSTEYLNDILINSTELSTQQLVFEELKSRGL